MSGAPGGLKTKVPGPTPSAGRWRCRGCTHPRGRRKASASTCVWGGLSKSGSCHASPKAQCPPVSVRDALRMIRARRTSIGKMMLSPSPGSHRSTLDPASFEDCRLPITGAAATHPQASLRSLRPGVLHRGSNARPKLVRATARPVLRRTQLPHSRPRSAEHSLTTAIDAAVARRRCRRPVRSRPPRRWASGTPSRCSTSSGSARLYRGQRGEGRTLSAPPTSCCADCVAGL